MFQLQPHSQGGSDRIENITVENPTERGENRWNVVEKKRKKKIPDEFNSAVVTNKIGSNNCVCVWESSELF